MNIGSRGIINTVTVDSQWHLKISTVSFFFLVLPSCPLSFPSSLCLSMFNVANNELLMTGVWMVIRKYVALLFFYIYPGLCECRLFWTQPLAHPASSRNSEVVYSFSRIYKDRPWFRDLRVLHSMCEFLQLNRNFSCLHTVCCFGLSWCGPTPLGTILPEYIYWVD